ncbi:hypothetical protein FRB99_006253 [Tulasnella sp. 403]|nr:hypothetical protein FRB99_006253 [Tulasnella sp. 403]
MAKKRAAEDAPPKAPRRAKAAKADANGDASAPSGKKAAPSSKAAAPKTMVPTSAQFLEHALPLHVHVTHTPPTTEKPGSSTDPTPGLSTDPGFVASIILAPSVFSSGSFGWKGSQRVVVELLNNEGEKEKVTVNMSFNATVPGSKAASAAAAGKKRRTRGKAKKADDDDDAGDEDDGDEDD